MRIELEELGVRVHVFGKGPTIVVLHGWGDNSQSWIPVATRLGAKFQWVLVDLPGAGESDLPPITWGFPEYVHCVERVIAELGLESFVLIGHSFGGKLACEITARAPSAVTGLILVAASGLQGKRFSVRARIALFKFLKACCMPFGATGERWVEQLRVMFGSRDYANAGSMRSNMVRILNADIRESLRRIRVPTLVLWGNDDSELPVRLAAKFVAQLPSAREQVIWNCGHFPHVEQTEEFIQILSRYLEGHQLELRAQA